LAPDGGWQTIKEAIKRRRSLGRGALLGIEALAAIATVAIVVISLVNHFTTEGESFPGEGKRVNAFRQVTNRICTEHRNNLQRALTDGRSRLERLDFVARALGWDLNDLETITPPPTRFNAFLDELEARRQARTEVLALQQAIEVGDHGAEAKAVAALEAIEMKSRELSRESGVIRCSHVLPRMRDLVRG
jgi:hypothetical protein